MNWIQSILVGTIPAAVTAVALLVQQQITSRAEERREEAARLHEVQRERALLVREAHNDGLRLISRLVHAWNLRRVALIYASRANTPAAIIAADAPERQIAESFELSARIGLVASPQAFKAFGEALAACDKALSEILQASSGAAGQFDLHESLMATAGKLRNHYRVEARRDCGFEETVVEAHVVPDARSRR